MVQPGEILLLENDRRAMEKITRHSAWALSILFGGKWKGVN